MWCHTWCHQCERCSWIQLPVSREGPSPRVPVVLELCQWDEGRGLTPPQTVAGVGYPGDRVFNSGRTVLT